MELGQKLRQARLEAGMSQRQLCAGKITRNMLSQIENGAAKPSMATLQHLAQMLGKSVSFFLEEEAVVSPNQARMAQARQFWDQGSWEQARKALAEYVAPDPVYDRERDLLWACIHLELARQAISQRQYPYAQELLEKAAGSQAYCSQELERQRLLLLGRLPGKQVAGLLPSLDGELQIRAREALSAGDLTRAGELLAAAQDKEDPDWNLLQGEVCYCQEQYRQAAEFFHRCEDVYPRETAYRLEQCYKALGQYKLAYEYACRQREDIPWKRW